MTEPIDIADYPGGFHVVLMHMGPLESLGILVMLGCLLFALFRTFSPTMNTLLVPLPLALGAGNALALVNKTSPFVVKALHHEVDLDLDRFVMSGLKSATALLTLGLIFSSLTFLAILFRNRRAATAR